MPQNEHFHEPISTNINIIIAFYPHIHYTVCECGVGLLQEMIDLN